MLEFSTGVELSAEIGARRARGRRIVFVPTMGNLHAGHRRLLERARELGDDVVASIYVNPLQFGPSEDFASYPRTLDDDRAMLADAGVAILFAPDERAIYPRGREHHTVVYVPQLSDILCGASRPGHFRGVTTVVARLFNLVTPDVAVFGKKDYQQLMIIRLMVADLAMPVEVVGVDTVREADGLALSSRNNYLSHAQRRAAPELHRALQQVVQALRGGMPAVQAEAAAADRLRDAGFQPDYVSVRRASDLAEPQAADKSLIVLAAARLGRTRLIDNVAFEMEPV